MSNKDEQEVIGILNDVEDKYRIFCDGYEGGPNCRQEYVHRRKVDGKKIKCEPVQLPCLDQEGNTVWVWVPHWISCPDQKDFLRKFMIEKAEQNAQWKAAHPKTDERPLQVRG